MIKVVKVKFKKKFSQERMITVSHLSHGAVADCNFFKPSNLRQVSSSRKLNHVIPNPNYYCS